MGVIEDRYIPSRQKTEEAELDAWTGVAPLPRLNMAPPEEEGKADISMTMTPKGPPPPKTIVGSVEQDINAGLKEAPKQILGGARDAIVNAAEFLLSYSAPSIPGTSEPALLSGAAEGVTPPVGVAQSVTGGLIRSASQFLTGFIPLSGAGGGAGILANMARGAAIDLTVFDPAQPRVSNLIDSLAPALRNPITTYLASTPDDTDAEGRLKNVLEGLALGAATDGVMRAAKAIKASKLLKSQEGSIKIPGVGTAEEAATQAKAFESPGRFNPAHQMASEEVTNLTAAINVRAREAGTMHAQTRGHVAWTETDKAANELVTSGKMSLERILALRPGDVLNAEEGMAARNIRDSAAGLFKDLMDMADRGDEVAKAGLEKAALLASRIETNVEASTGTEIARALAIRRRASLAYEIDDIYQRLTQRTIDPEILYQFYKHLTDNTQREAFTKYLETTSATGRWINAFLEARAAGLLTLRSIERNLVGSGSATIWSVPERAATAVVGGIRGTEEGAYAYEAIEMMHGIYHAQANALITAGKALKTGESQFLAGSSQTEQHFLPAISGDALNLHGPMGRFFDVLGEVIRWPFRGLVAGDDYLKYTNYEAQKWALAYREYRRLLKSGASEAQAAKEYSQIIKNPPEWLDQAASEHALYTTFNDEVINRAGKAIMAIRQGDDPVAQISRFILPFARTPMDVMGYGAERTPGLNFLSSHYWQEIQAGGVRKDAAYARLALGSGVMAIFSVLAANGAINGKGPKDPKLRKLYMDNGWTPYSINLPGMNPIPFLGFSPLSEVMGQAADFGEMVNQGADDMTLARLAGAMVLSTAHVMEEYPMLKGLADIHDAIRESSGRSEGIIQEALKSMLPFPGVQGLARTAAGVTDPYQRETRSPQGGPRLPGTLGFLDREVSALWEEMAASTPWLQNYQHPKRDILGRPLLRQGGWWALAPNAPSAQEPHPVLDEIRKHKIPVGLPAKAFGPGKQVLGVMDDESLDANAVSLSPDEWARFQELAGTITLSGGFPSPHGRPLAQELSRIIASSEYQREADGPVGGKASLIKLAFREYRDAAKDALFKELRKDGKPGDLERLVNEKARLQEFKGMTKAQQEATRPGLEKDLGRPINIGILR